MSYEPEDFARAVKFIVRASRRNGGFIVFDHELISGSWYADHHLPIDDRPIVIGLGPKPLSQKEAFEALSSSLEAAGIERKDQRKAVVKYRSRIGLAVEIDVSEWEIIPGMGDTIKLPDDLRVTINQVTFDYYGNVQMEAS